MSQKKQFKFNKLSIVLSFAFIAIATQGQDGLQVLKQTESTLGEMAFYAKCKWSGYTDIVLQKKDKSGFYLTKSQIILEVQGVSLTNTFILNEDGLWDVHPGIALRMDFLKLTNNSVFYGLLQNRSAVTVDGEYELISKKINGRNAYLVTQKLKPDGSIRDSEQAVENKFVIGQTDYLLYGFSSTLKNGATTEMSVEEIKKVKNMPDNIFSLPNGIHMVVCSNAQQYSQAILPINVSIAKSPQFAAATRNYYKKFTSLRYAIIGILLIPPVAFILYCFRKKTR